MNKSYALGAVFVVAILLGAIGLVLMAPEKDTGEGITVVDMVGREVTVPEKVDRIVCIGAGSLRFITYLEGTDKVVGIEDHEVKTGPTDIGGRTYRAAHPELAELPTIGPIHKGDDELIIKANPQVIFKSSYEAGDCDDLQNKLGIPVVALTNQVDLGPNIELFYKQIRLIGEVLDKDDRAEDLISNTKKTITDLEDRVKDIPEAEKLRVYVGGISYSGAHGIDSTSCKYPPFDFLNANNVITVGMMKNKTVGQIDIEILPELNPQVMFIDWGGYELCKNDYVQYKASLDDIDAVKNGELYGVLQYNWYATNYDSLLANCYYVGTVLFPEEFADVDPEQKTDEIYEFWVGASIYDEVVKNCGGGFEKVSLA